MTEPLYIYGNWSAYDELSDGVELTEELAMRQFGEMLRLRSLGVQFDGYLMDAFWFASGGGYREWRTPNWPNGPDRWLAACAENGILPGMWFTVNTLCHLDPAPAWQDSVDAKHWGMCLFVGGFLADFVDLLHGWYERGIRIFKFDFADFGAIPAGCEDTIAQDEVRARNVRAFREAMAAFRFEHSDAILMAFNGFEDCECMERTDRPITRFIDPAWLDVFDSIYCGDPRPADVPDVDFWRSVDLYADHMTRAFEKSQLPLDRIDACAFMAGPTGTCYWRGKAGWQRMLLLSYARGGRIHVAYGDLSLFTDEDAGWWANVQDLYRSAMTPGGTVSWGGIPGKCEPYGWRSADSGGQILTVVNPSLFPDAIAIPQGHMWSVVTHDPGFEPVVSDDRLIAGGGQMVVLSESAAVVAFEIDPSGTRSSAGTVVDPTTGKQSIGGAEFEFPALGSGSATLVVWQLDATGRLVRTWPTPERSWVFTVEIVVGSESIGLPPQPEKLIWSGVSWAAFELPASAHEYGFTARIRSADETARRILGIVLVC